MFRVTLLMGEDASKVVGSVAKVFLPLVTMSVVAGTMTKVNIVDGVAQAAMRSQQFDELEELL